MGCQWPVVSSTPCRTPTNRPSSICVECISCMRYCSIDYWNIEIETDLFRLTKLKVLSRKITVRWRHRVCLRPRTATPVSKSAVFEIGRSRNWEREIGGGTRVTLCHTSIRLPISTFFRVFCCRPLQFPHQNGLYNISKGKGL